MTLRAHSFLFSLAVTAIALALAGLVAVSTMVMVTLNHNMGRLSVFRADIMQAEGLATEILLDSGVRPVVQWEKLYQVLQADLSDAADWLPGGAIAADEFSRRLQAMDKAFLRLANMAPGAAPAVRAVLVLQLRTNKDALLSRLSEIERDVRLEVEAGQRWMMVAAVAIIAILLALSVGHYFVTRHVLLSAFEEVRNVIRRLDRGQLDAPIVTRRRGEVRQILDSLDTMRAHMHDAIQRETEQRQRAEQLNRAKSDFVASVSHELRTPLTGLLGRLDLAAQRDTMAALQDDLAQASHAGRHLLVLVNQVLDFSRIESRHLELTVEPFDPREVVLALETMIGAQAEEKGLDLRIAFAPPQGEAAVLLSGDMGRIQQVLLNLIGNAIKFTPAGSVTVEGRLEASEGDRAVLDVAVSDTGPGVPEEARERIFEQFVQLEQSGDATQTGTGLGLAISDRLVREMGGSIEVGAAAGGGACFRLRLELPVVAAAPAEEAPDAETVPQPGLCVLVVEDVAFNRDIVREFLTSVGHRVEEASDGAAAIRKLAESGPFDAVLMDINMPGMDGIEATRRIRASAMPWAQVPILGLTANAFQEQRRTYLEAGMTGCLSKPVVWPELLARLSEVTGRPASAPRCVVRGAGQGKEKTVQDGAAGPAAEAAVPAEAAADPALPLRPAAASPLVDPQQFEDLVTYMGIEQTVKAHRDALDHLAAELPSLQGIRDIPVQLAQSAHALAGVASNFGFPALADALRQLERTAPSGSFDRQAADRLADLLAATRVEAEAMVAAMAEPSAAIR